MARLAAAGLIFALGTAGAVAVVGQASADPPVGLPATVYVTQTVHVRTLYRGHSAGFWHLRNVQKGALLKRSAKRLRANHRALVTLRVSMRRRWAPTVSYALELARAAWGVDQTERARCESKLNPFAAEGHGPLGLLQFQPSTWRRTPFARFSIYDPVAQALAGGWMIEHGRSGEWSCRL